MEWLFGYGSIVWRPAFEYEEWAPAVLAGWRRRLWQGSTDHRGVPGAPGRVATLVPEAAARCQGVAYRIPAAERPVIAADLDHREKNGYERRELEVALADGRRVTAVTYIAGADNPHYLGPAPLAQMAAEVRAASGPSGSNLEYVLRLAEALRRLDAGADQDEEVLALVALLP